MTITWGAGGRPSQLSSSPPANSSSSTNITLGPAPAVAGATPNSGFVNVVLCGLESSQGTSGTAATVMLDNPVVKNGLTGAGLLEQVGGKNKPEPKKKNSRCFLWSVFLN